MHARPAGLIRSLALLATLLPVAAAGQAPGVPDLPADQLSFEARSSVLLGSGARALGMGGAFLARPDDATASSWNPAGLSYLRVPEVSLVVGRNAQRRRDPDAGIVQDDFVGTSPDFVAATYPIEVGPALGAVQLSFQRVFSYTGDRELEQLGENSRRFDLASRGGIDVYALGTGLSLARQLRVGITLNRWGNGYHQRSQRTAERTTTQDQDFQLEAWNVNMGVIYSPVESLNLGAVVKTPFAANASFRRARVDRYPTGIVTSNAAFRRDLRVDVPLAVGAGLSWRPISRLTLALDLTRTLWSDGHIRSYYTLRSTDPGAQAPGPEVYERLPYPSLDDLDQQDTTQFRTGAEYVVLRGRFGIPLRAGFFTDSQYFRDSNGRSPLYKGFTAGTGLLLGDVLLDAAYLRVSGNYLEDPTAPHRVSSRFQRVLVSVIYRHSR